MGLLVVPRTPLEAKLMVKTELGYEVWPCPGCLQPITISNGNDDDADYHHGWFRERTAVTDAQKIALYHRLNGTLAHHSCHMEEEAYFVWNTAAILLNRAGKPHVVQAWSQKLPIAYPHLPSIFYDLTMKLPKMKPVGDCPACGSRRVYRTGHRPWPGTGQKIAPAFLCLDCLWNRRAA